MAEYPDVERLYKAVTGRKPKSEDIRRLREIAASIPVEACKDPFFILIAFFDLYCGLSRRVRGADLKETVLRVGVLVLCVAIVFAAGWTWIYKDARATAYAEGKELGIEIGMRQNRDEELRLRERDAFMKTEDFAWVYDLHKEGRLQGLRERAGFLRSDDFAWAYRLHKEGELKKLRNCVGEGWQVLEGRCFVAPVYGKDGKVSRWDSWPVN